MERLFYGRAALQAATALFYFTKGSAVQESLHRMKYGAAVQIGLRFGGWMAERMAASQRFADCDLVIALPLHAARERKRGYNQAGIIAGALASGLKIPVSTGNPVRCRAAGSQTKKDRIDRWKQIHGSFRLLAPEKLRVRNILLVDDVVTTGATLEAAARILLAVPGVRLSIAAVACSVAV